MTRAYQETDVSKAQEVLGDALDYAVNSCDIPGSEFILLFIASEYAKRMEKGEPAVLSGKSGIELVHDIVYETTGKELDKEAGIRYERSSEYWIGWVSAYYQWYSGRTYQDIFSVFSFDELERMYVTLHEADISKSVDIMEERMKAVFKETALKRKRVLYGCSQSELSRMSGVSLRSIQMYEQKNKDINKASGDTLFALSRVLGCSMEDLLEKR